MFTIQQHSFKSLIFKFHLKLKKIEKQVIFHLNVGSKILLENFSHEMLLLLNYFLLLFLQFRNTVLQVLAADIGGSFIIDRVMRFLFGKGHLRST